MAGLHKCCIVQHADQPPERLPLGHQWADGGLGVRQAAAGFPAAQGDRPALILQYRSGSIQALLTAVCNISIIHYFDHACYASGEDLNRVSNINFW